MSISVKSNLLTEYVKLKDLALENEARIREKQCRPFLPTSLKQSKYSYFANYFQNNLNDLKSTWKGIKNWPLLKNHLTVVSTNFVQFTIFDNDCSASKRKEMANDFNKYFSALLVKLNLLLNTLNS